MSSMDPIVLALDLFGAFVFALSGAMAGVRHRLDVFGVLVLSFAAGNAGGITRDLLIGAVPPAALSRLALHRGVPAGWHADFLAHGSVRRLQDAVLVFDAAGLAVFAVSGALKALAFGLNPLAAVLLGMLTGIGGGMLRDVLVAEVPTVLRAELYAVAASLERPSSSAARSWAAHHSPSRSSGRSCASGCASSPSDVAGGFRSPRPSIGTGDRLGTLKSVTSGRAAGRVRRASGLASAARERPSAGPTLKRREAGLPGHRRGHPGYPGSAELADRSIEPRTR